MKSKLFISIMLFLILFIVGAFMMQYLQSSLRGTTMILGVDLYPRWVGTQAALHNESPYSTETRQQIWLALYGSTDAPNGNPFGFYYPPAVITLFMPFVLMGLPMHLAAVLWCAFLWAAFSTALLFWIINLGHLKNRLVLLPLLLISGWLFRPAFSNYLLGQFALFSVLAAIAAWLAIRNNLPVWAGIFAALSLVKPSLTIVPIALLLIDLWRKPRGILAFIGVTLILYLPPTVLIGWWLPDFLADIANYAQENSVAWSGADSGTVSGSIWLLTSLGLIVIGMYKKNNMLTFGAATALNAIFIPHSADYDLVAFIPLLIYLGDLWLKKKNGSFFFSALYFGILWTPWLSLIAMILLNTGGNSVEAWYRFIWLTYPPVILLLSMLTQTPSLQSTIYRISRNTNIWFFRL